MAPYLSLTPLEQYQFEDCHPVNPVTGDIIPDLLQWFMVTHDHTLYPTPQVDGPWRNCSALPDEARVIR